MKKFIIFGLSVLCMAALNPQWAQASGTIDDPDVGPKRGPGNLDAPTEKTPKKEVEAKAEEKKPEAEASEKDKVEDSKKSDN